MTATEMKYLKVVASMSTCRRQIWAFVKPCLSGCDHSYLVSPLKTHGFAAVTDFPPVDLTKYIHFWIWCIGVFIHTIVSFLSLEAGIFKATEIVCFYYPKIGHLPAVTQVMHCLQRSAINNAITHLHFCLGLSCPCARVICKMLFGVHCECIQSLGECDLTCSR